MCHVASSFSTAFGSSLRRETPSLRKRLGVLGYFNDDGGGNDKKIEEENTYVQSLLHSSLMGISTKFVKKMHSRTIKTIVAAFDIN